MTMTPNNLTAARVDGVALAREVLAQVRKAAAGLPSAPRLVFVQDSRRPSAVGERYVRQKLAAAKEAGIEAQLCVVGHNSAALPEVLEQLLPEGVQVVVQLPVANRQEQEAALAILPAPQDPDCIGKEARERFARGESPVLPPVVAAVAHILATHGITLKGKKVAIVGKGYLVGEPAAVWFSQQGAEVVVVEKGAPLVPSLRDADIVVAGAGVPALITPEMLKEGVVLLDAATSEEGGALVGDVANDATHKASLWTPVPGGIGPLAVAKLLENVVTLARLPRDASSL